MITNEKIYVLRDDNHIGSHLSMIASGNDLKEVRCSLLKFFNPIGNEAAINIAFRRNDEDLLKDVLSCIDVAKANSIHIDYIAEYGTVKEDDAFLDSTFSLAELIEECIEYLGNLPYEEEFANAEKQD